jgi:hypothetical protein
LDDREVAGVERISDREDLSELKLVKNEPVTFCGEGISASLD